MKVLVADDSPISRSTVRKALVELGCEVVEACDGPEAFERMTAPEGPHIAVLDWLMPGLDGPDVCEALRRHPFEVEPYLILLTGKCSKEDLLEGLGKGADEFLSKPFLGEELRARIRVGERLVGLSKALIGRVRDLEEAMGRIRKLEGLLPICMYCHKIRQADQAWKTLEDYLLEYTDVKLSHGLCPDCQDRFLHS